MKRGCGWADVRRIALALPGVRERSSHDLAAWTIGDKLFVWERPLRPSDLRALGADAPEGPILGVRVESFDAKDALLAGKRKFAFTTPHFDGYPAILVRLDRIGLADLENLIVEAWLARAPKRLLRQYER